MITLITHEFVYLRALILEEQVFRNKKNYYSVSEGLQKNMLLHISFSSFFVVLPDNNTQDLPSATFPVLKLLMFQDSSLPVPLTCHTRHTQCQLF
jgi:hypothetical protein